MSYLKGSGIASDPYVIHNVPAAELWFGTDNYTSGKYAVLVTDLDLSGQVYYSGNVTPRGHLDGYGHTITGLDYFKGNDCTGSYKRIAFVSLSHVNTSGFQGGSSVEFIDCTFEGGSLKHHYPPPSHKFERVVTRNVSVGYNYSGNLTAIDAWVVGGSPRNKFTSLVDDPSPYSTAHYPSLVAMSDLWTVDGSSIPRLKKQSVSHLVEAYALLGTSALNGVGSVRTITALAPDDFSYISRTTSDENGSWLVTTGLYSDHVYVTASDLYGQLPLTNFGYSVGDVIHPVTTNGYRYVCAVAGNSGGTLPAEPWATTGNLVVGGATFEPRVMNKPVTHGPIKPVLVNLTTGQPV
jgi:hypothetical protein